MPGKRPENTEKMKIHLNSFIGGQAVDFKYGISNSFYSSQNLDFRSKPSQMSVLPGAQNLSNTMQDLVTAMVQDPNGVRYAVGNKGYIYRVSTSNVISPIGQLTSNGSAGIAYNQQSDQLYIPGQQTVSLYGQVQQTPTYRADNFGPSASVANAVIYIYDTLTLSYDGNVDTNTGLTTQRNNLNSLTATGVTPTNYATQVTNTLTNTYSVPNAISETVGQFCPFVPDIEPMYSVAVYVTTVGTGNWTLTMHDSLNNNLGAVTITNGNMVKGWNNFVFTAPGIRAIINPIANGTGEGYHFHLTSSVASDTAAVATIASQNLQGCNMVYFAYRLLKTNNGWHPTTLFNQYLCIGNGPYLSTYNFANDSNPNNTQWVRHQLLLDFGYEVTSLSANNQYLVIAAEKRSNNSSRNYQDGMLYFWDGINSTYNFKIDIPMGAPYSMYSLNNVTYFYCAGSLFAWGGGQQVVKIRYMAYQNTDYLDSVDNTVINPNMMDVRYNLLMLGYPSTTTNPNINYGIYSWGAVEMTFPNSFGYSYSLSNGLQNNTGTTNLQIGMIKNFVDSLYQSWQYTDANSITHYGLDVINNFSEAAPTFSWASLIWDGGVRYKTKRALRYKIAFEALDANATITAWYSIDRGPQISADPITGVPYTAVTGATALTVELDNARFKELQWGFTGTCSDPTAIPTITGVTMELDPLTDEVDIRPEVPYS
jgi:hypothetical protein